MAGMDYDTVDLFPDMPRDDPKLVPLADLPEAIAILVQRLRQTAQERHRSSRERQLMESAAHELVRAHRPPGAPVAD